MAIRFKFDNYIDAINDKKNTPNCAIKILKYD